MVRFQSLRVRHAFIHQIADLSGLNWHLERASIRAVQAARGADAAESEAQRLVVLRLYPPTLVPAVCY